MECGVEEFKKFQLIAPKNATYLSSATFDVIIAVLNKFTEEPLLESIKHAKSVTLFHDETVEISNHSEAVLFGMYLHKGC